MRGRCVGERHRQIKNKWEKCMKLTGNRSRMSFLATVMVALVFAAFDRTVAAEPIKIGFSMALTGAYAGNGKAALLATQMWADDQNAKVGLVISGYGTNIIGPAMPPVMQHNKVFMSLAGLRVNEQFRYDRYFQIFPFGPDADVTFAQGFFDVA